jgi:hypothetical protein
MVGVPLWLIGLVAAVAVVLAGGVLWAREWAVADPNLRLYAEELVPVGGEVVSSEGEDCDATNGWDRWYRPQDTCHQVFWSLRGQDEGQLRTALVEHASETGWKVVEVESREFESRTIRLERRGYLAFLSVMADVAADRCADGAKALPDPAPELCTHTVMVMAD